MRLLISGYGGNSGDTAGVYDLDKKRFVWQSGIKSISYMCCGDTFVSGNNRLACVETFFGAGEHDGHGFVYMFTADTDAPGGYRLADTVRIDGGALCHIAYSEKHKILTGACYGSGDVFSLEVKPSGPQACRRFGEMKSYLRQGGAEAEVSRAHCVVFGADEDELYSANIALDKIFCYKIKNDELLDGGWCPLDRGVGPRHLKMINGRWYVITEYSNEIILLGNGWSASENSEALRNAAMHERAVRGSFVISEAVGTRVSTLPDGFSGESYCSAMCFLPVNTEYGYLYAANRGADTVAVFKLNTSDGALKKIHDCGCGGKWPRHIEIIPSEEGPMLASANQQSGEVVIFEISGDGSLGGEKLRIPFEGVAFVGGMFKPPALLR